MALDENSQSILNIIKENSNLNDTGKCSSSFYVSRFPMWPKAMMIVQQSIDDGDFFFNFCFSKMNSVRYKQNRT